LLTPGNCADITTAYELAAQLPSNGCLIGDMGYDALELRQTLAFQGTATVIPTNPTHKHKWPIDLKTYKERNLVDIDQAWRLSRISGVAGGMCKPWWPAVPRGRRRSDSLQSDDRFGICLHQFSTTTASLHHAAA
jgi:transposase